LNFKELGTYKDKIISMFAANEDIIDLIMPTLDYDRFEVSDNFIGGEFQTVENGIVKNVILKGHCFDTPFIYSSITDSRNCICIDTNISNADGESIKEMSITIEVMCNKANLQMDSESRMKYVTKGLSGNRLDMIVEEIGLQLNSSRQFGIGKFKPAIRNPVHSYFPNEDYFGKVLTYTCSDFMADYAERSLNGH
jgi:hypothetical protein